MLLDKITKNFKEISKFFVENFDNSTNAIFTVLDMLKLSDKSLCFSTNYNAKYSLVKLLSLIYNDDKVIESSFRPKEISPASRCKMLEKE